MTDAQVEGIVEDYVETLPNTSVPHPKCLVLLSGIVGSGKSTLARAIEQNLQAVRLSNDELRERIVTVEPSIALAPREAAKFKAATEVRERLRNAANGLVVIDASCDRSFDHYRTWAAVNGYRLVLLRLQVDRAEIERRLHARGDTSTKKAVRMIEMLDTWWREWEKFGETHRPDMFITPTTPSERVVDLIRRIVAELAVGIVQARKQA
jgi:predicted kinase